MTLSHHHEHWMKQCLEQQDSSQWHVVKGLRFRMEIEAETPGIICVQGRYQILLRHINILTALKWYTLCGHVLYQRSRYNEYNNLKAVVQSKRTIKLCRKLK